MLVLIVDDNYMNIKITQKMLDKLEVESDFAMSGFECLKKTQENRYNMIFMDIMMPGMDGIETLNNLQMIDGFETPVIALTADVYSGAKEKYLELGFEEYIKKPINIDYLKFILDKYNQDEILKLKK